MMVLVLIGIWVTASLFVACMFHLIHFDMSESEPWDEMTAARWDRNHGGMA